MAHQANGRNYRFYGVGMNKAARRANSQRGSRADRKYYAYVTADQKGTPMENMINNGYAELDEQFNAMRSHPNGLQMRTNESTGRLNQIWNRTVGKMTKGRSIGNYVGEHGGTMRNAVAALERISGVVHFGADPKRA